MGGLAIRDAWRHWKTFGADPTVPGAVMDRCLTVMCVCVAVVCVCLIVDIVVLAAAL